MPLPALFRRRPRLTDSRSAGCCGQPAGMSCRTDDDPLDPRVLAEVREAARRQLTDATDLDAALGRAPGGSRTALGGRRSTADLNAAAIAQVNSLAGPPLLNAAPATFHFAPAGMPVDVELVTDVLAGLRVATVAVAEPDRPIWLEVTAVRVDDAPTGEPTGAWRWTVRFADDPEHRGITGVRGSWDAARDEGLQELAVQCAAAVLDEVGAALLEALDDVDAFDPIAALADGMSIQVESGPLTTTQEV